MPLITLSNGSAALIDDIDADLLRHRWWGSGCRRGYLYAQRTASEDGPRRKKHMHREIGERIHGGAIPRGAVVDHINGDTLDNRRCNLRVVSHRENVWNQHGAGRDSQSGLRGVRAHRNSWHAYICEGRKMHHLGAFDTKEQAYAARLAAEARRLALAA
jgi:hypothetical protein